MRRPIGFVVAAMLVVGCGGAAPQAGSPAPQSPPLAAPANTVPAPSDRRQAEDDLRLDLLEPGVQPRAPLRYRFHVGQREKMTMDMKMDMAMEPPGRSKVAVMMPTIVFSSIVDSRSLTADGDLVYGFVTDRIDVLEDAAVKPEVRSKLQADMKQLAGLKGEAVVTPRGLSKSAEFQIPAGAGPHMAETIDSMRQSMRQLATPFPIEPVGRGAKWKTTSTIRTKAFSFVQVTTYTLVSESEGRAMLDIKLEQRADSQVVKLDGMPPDVTTTLDSFHGRGAGHPTLDFDRLTPDSESEIEAHARFKAEHGGEAVSFGNDFRINFKIRSN